MILTQEQVEIIQVAKTLKINEILKIKAFAVLSGDDSKEPLMLGNAVGKLYDFSKDQIYKQFA
ncbi:hypothetical protein [Aliarcobacter skirrowii]|uniref:hypothetical protein n=1 Tax=Aliarcobacter skirrowii TaxID=28200 RepID=UPI0029BEDC38|nr:hypothetical protein [Aliarcobacter skirrowii]MDX4036219.1 hypothetical protein [Aliarcobacter skirrowii]